MSNDYARSPWWWLWLLVAIVVSWSIIGWSGYGVYKYFHPCPTVKARGDGLAERWIVARMTKHGIHNQIPAPTCNKETGACVFKRDGKKCQL